MTGQVPDTLRPREEEQVESDFSGDEDVVAESKVHAAKGFWVCAYPLASKEAADMLAASQTFVGQVNSEFQGDVTRMIRVGAVRRLDGDPAWEISGGQVREWARTKGFKVTSIAGGDPSHNSRAVKDVSEF